jgi:hypothetical protein
MARGPLPDLDELLLFLPELFWKRSDPLPVRCLPPDDADDFRWFWLKLFRSCWKAA